MKQRHLRFLSITLCSLFAITTPYTIAVQNQMPEISSTEQEVIKKLYTETAVHFCRLENIAQHLAQLIESKQCKPNNPQAAQAWLLEVTHCINKLRTELNTTITINALSKHIIFIEEITNHLGHVVKHEFATLPIIPEETFINRMIIDKDYTSAELDYKQENVKKEIETLELQAGQVGLSTVNRLYRKVTSLDPYGLFLPTAKAGSLLAVLGGSTALFTTLVLQIKSWKDVKNIYDPKNEEFLSFIKKQLASAALIGLATKLYSASGNAILDMANSFNISEKLSILHHTLKGTNGKIAPHSTQYIEDITLEDPLFDGMREDFKPLYDILEFIKDPAKYISTKMNISKSILLYGPSGCGKSFTAKAFAGSVNKLLKEMGEFKRFGFIEIEPWELQNWGINVVENILEKAEGNAPCVIFLDEFHLADGGLQVNSNNKLLNEFLKALDQLAQNNDPQKQVFIIAATNRVELLDQALLREGRLGRGIKFSYPNCPQRVHLLEQLCKKSAIDTSNIDFEFFAQLTKGTSYSDLNYMFTKAAFIAKNNAQGICSEHLYQALNENIRKVRKKTPLSRFEQDIVAAHIAGQSFGYCLFEHTNKLEAATILPAQPPIVEKYDWQVKEEQVNTKAPREDKQKLSHGAVYYCDQSEEIPQEAPETTCKHLLSGLVAQKVLCGNTAFSLENRHEALLIVQKILLQGINLENLSKIDQNNIKSQSYTIVQQYEQEITQLFEQHKDALELLRTTLLEKQFLRAEEINTILDL